MILIRKNVYKDVYLFENVFNVLEMCVFVLKIERIVFLKWSKLLEVIYLLKMSFLFIFFSFDIVVLPLTW